MLMMTYPMNLLRAACGLALALFTANAALAVPCDAADDAIVLMREVSGNVYSPGGTVDVHVTLCYSGLMPIVQLGLLENIPAGWTYEGASGEAVPVVKPAPGTTDTLEFAYIFAPSMPASFSYTLRVPADATGDAQIAGHALFALDGPQTESNHAVTTLAETDPVVEEPEGEEEPALHCADTGEAIVLTRQVAGNVYEPGAEVLITVTFCYTGNQTVTSLGLEETLPAGWLFKGVAAGNPDIRPKTNSEGTLPFAYIFINSFPISFTYRALVPEDATGEQQVAGQGIYSFSGSQITTNEEITLLVEGTIPVEPEGELEGEPEAEPIDLSIHSADFNADGVIDLSEMLRLVQFYNAGALSCAEDSEDGYDPLGNVIDCLPHATDFAPQDWSINLTELLRMVQFYNAGAYHYCPGEASEDGYCIGVA